MVEVGCAAVQDVLVVQELDLAHLHHHVHLQAGAGALEHVSGVKLSGGEGRNEAGVGEAGGGAEEMRVESGRGGGQGGWVSLMGASGCFEVVGVRDVP